MKHTRTPDESNVKGTFSVLVVRTLVLSKEISRHVDGFGLQRQRGRGRELQTTLLPTTGSCTVLASRYVGLVAM